MPGLEALLCGLIEEYGPESIIIAGSLPKSRFVRGLSDLDILVMVAREAGKHERSVYSAGEVLRYIRGRGSIHPLRHRKRREVYGDWRARAMRRPKEAGAARS